MSAVRTCPQNVRH